MHAFLIWTLTYSIFVTRLAKEGVNDMAIMVLYFSDGEMGFHLLALVIRRHSECHRLDQDLDSVSHFISHFISQGRGSTLEFSGGKETSGANVHTGLVVGACRVVVFVTDANDV